jgi:hypothetical protein
MGVKLSLRHLHRLREFEKKVLGRIFGPRREEKRDWYRLLVGKPAGERPLRRPI